jgi:predicted extracellular nuclease
MRRTTSLLLASFTLASLASAQISVNVGTPVTQNFDSLASTGTSSTVPSGWVFIETGANANSTYTAGTGSSNAGDTYSFGAAGNSERAFGGVQSGNLVPTISANFVNSSGQTITSLQVTYTGEQWRLGATGRTDRLDFQYSVSTGVWVDVDELDFNAPNSLGTVGALDGNAAANRREISFTITGLNIAPGATFAFRWNSFDATGADDGLAIDDFSMTATGSGGTPCPTITLTPTSLQSLDQGTPVSVQLTASGGVAPYTYQVSSGTLPTGVNLVGDTLTGTTTANGTFNFAVRATDSTSGATCSGTQSYSWQIVPVVTVTGISGIQGSGATSPLVGQSVVTRGIVTARLSNGFFIQTPDAEVDADPATSEGVFVFTSTAPPATAAVGNLVRVAGTVVEFASAGSRSLTEISAPTVTQLSTGNAMPTPVPITTANLTANGGVDQLERFEGMLVSVESLTVVAATGGTTSETSATGNSNGVFSGVLTGQATPFREAGIDPFSTVPLCAAGSNCTIPLFDGNPERILVDSDRAGSILLNVNVGQVVTNLVGVLDWATTSYRINPTSPPTVGGTSVSEGFAPTPRANEVTIAKYNVERFYDTTDAPGVSDVVVTTTAFNNRLNKLSLAIRNNLKLPDVVAFEEVENLGVMQAIADKVSADAGVVGLYTPYLVEGNDVGGIDVGFIVKNTVAVTSVTQVGAAATYTNPCTGTQELLNDRPPLVLRGSVTKGGRTIDLVVIGNHLRSLNGVNDESACSNGPRVRAKRAAQAEFLANLIQSEQTSNPNVRLVVTGDMNAFEVNDGYTDVVGTLIGAPAPGTQVATGTNDLVNPNLTNMLTIIPDVSQRFSYVFDGSHQTLDHILFSQGLSLQVTGGQYVRLNSEFAEVLRGDPNSPLRLSDHDPGILYLTTAQPITSGITVQRTGLIRNSVTGIYSGNIVLRNTGTAALTGPFTVALTGLPSGVTLANATGTNYQGAFLVNNATTIAAGGTLAVPVQFTNPANVLINYTTKVYSGAF